MPLNEQIPESSELRIAIENLATHVVVTDERSMGLLETRYHFIPFWFEEIGRGMYRLHQCNDLPKELEEALKNFQIESVFQIEPA
jgi:hypothetical protein